MPFKIDSLNLGLIDHTVSLELIELAKEVLVKVHVIILHHFDLGLSFGLFALHFINV